MNKYLKHLLWLGLLGLSGSAYAEGGSCPSGYYPVGGQGTQGCAPIPNYNRGQQQGSSQQSAPQPIGYWVKTWGAIATSETGGALGTAVGAADKTLAEQAAIRDCEMKGGDGCRIDLTYHNQCAAVVLGENFLRLYGAGSIDKASKNGMRECAKTSNKCRVYYSACTEPRFVKY